jgi:L-2-hydroxyglutarate oxidase
VASCHSLDELHAAPDPPRCAHLDPPAALAPRTARFALLLTNDRESTMSLQTASRPSTPQPTQGPLPTTCDLVVVGGGLVGLATAYALLQRRPGASIVVLEKEERVAFHQSGRNSGVIHSGLYYKPGSRKARTCREGRLALLKFCEEHGVAHSVCGKVIVATEPEELPRLERLHERATENGIATTRLDPAGLRDFEPHATGLAALHVPAAGVCDYKGMARTLVEQIAARGGAVHTGTEVRALRREAGAGDTRWTLEVQGAAGSSTLRARALVNCAGLWCDRIARRAGARPTSRIVPFRGEYYDLRPERADLVRTLIYPVPDPRFPFLGVHFTRGFDGTVECGPNAVFALRRDGYKKTDVSLRDLYDSLTFPGFWRLTLRHLRTGLAEQYRSFVKAAFVRALQRLVPEVRADDLVPGGAGVRAQALTTSGQLVDDFDLLDDDAALHVLNAPSPAATACLAIADEIATRAPK